MHAADLLSSRARLTPNREALLDLIVKTSHLMAALPLVELDLNPVIFYDEHYAVADARVTIKSKQDRKGTPHG